MRLAKKLGTTFDDKARRAGRALLRRRRVRVMDADDRVTCLEVRAPEGKVIVLLIGDHLCSCSCAGDTPRARCGHAWAGVLARDRLAARDRGAHAEGRIQCLPGQQIR